MENNQKLSMKYILKKNLDICLENIKPLGVLAISMQLALYVNIAAQKFAQLDIKYLMVSLVSAIFMMYAINKVSIIHGLFVFNILEGNETSIDDAMKKSKGLFWPFVGKTLLFVLICIVPLVIFITFASVMQGFMKYVAYALLAVVFFALYARFGLAPYIRILYPGYRGVFNYNGKMVQGNYIRVMVLASVAVIANMIVDQGIGLIRKHLVNNLVVSGIEIILSIPASIYGMTLTIVLIHELNKFITLKEVVDVKHDDIENNDDNII